MKNTSSVEVIVGEVTSDEQIIKKFGLGNNPQSIISKVRNDMNILKKDVAKKFPIQHNEMILSSCEFSTAWETTRVINGDITPLYYLASYLERYQKEIEPFIFGSYLQEPFQTLFIKHFVKRK